MNRRPCRALQTQARDLLGSNREGGLGPSLKAAGQLHERFPLAVCAPRGLRAPRHMRRRQNRWPPAVAHALLKAPGQQGGPCAPLRIALALRPALQTLIRQAPRVPVPMERAHGRGVKPASGSRTLPLQLAGSQERDKIAGKSLGAGSPAGMWPRLPLGAPGLYWNALWTRRLASVPFCG